MNILAVASVEDDTNILKQLAKQTLLPTSYFIHVDKKPAKKINDRRKRIAENQKILADKVREIKPDLVWQLEGDGDLPETALEDLYAGYLTYRSKDFGYISGIEVGRHGLYCLGAWTNITENSFESLDYKLRGIQQVQATGFYCLLAPAEVWLKGKAEWNGEPYGPDVVWGLSLKDYKIYCDMEIKIGHLYKGKTISHPDYLSTENVKFYKENNKWNYKTSR